MIGTKPEVTPRFYRMTAKDYSVIREMDLSLIKALFVKGDVFIVDCVRGTIEVDAFNDSGNPLAIREFLDKE